jgi:hypothetical protein
MSSPSNTHNYTKPHDLPIAALQVHLVRKYSEFEEEGDSDGSSKSNYKKTGPKKLKIDESVPDSDDSDDCDDGDDGDDSDNSNDSDDISEQEVQQSLFKEGEASASGTANSCDLTESGTKEQQSNEPTPSTADETNTAFTRYRLYAQTHMPCGGPSQASSPSSTSSHTINRSVPSRSPSPAGTSSARTAEHSVRPISTISEDSDEGSDDGDLFTQAYRKAVDENMEQQR